MTEREAFEAWAKVRYAKNPHFWLRQIDDGGYSCGMADSAWDAWQAARAQPAQAGPSDVVRDAERYRWLRDASVAPHNFYISVPDEFHGVKYQPGEVDAYIDAAIAAQGEKP